MTLVLITWIVCAIPTYAITFGYFQNNPYWDLIRQETYTVDRAFAIFYSFFGPVGLGCSLFLSSFCKYGLKWK
jgi:hypothetical protein